MKRTPNKYTSIRLVNPKPYEPWNRWEYIKGGKAPDPTSNRSKRRGLA